MPSAVGSFTLGPSDATLLIKTGRTGPAAKMGHDLDIRVNRWSAQLELAEDPDACRLSLDADSHSLEVLGASDAPDALSDADKAKIAATIDDRIFKGGVISFTSSAVTEPDPDGLRVEGELNLLGGTGPVQFSVTVGPDGQLEAHATVIQSAFGITPHSAMMGALRLADAVELTLDGRLPPA